ncbi:GAP1-N1 domain-containing protein [Mycobacteroides immunogenum]|uniref:GAP1-N1 domain-containing protein n=1 Tax=Mycobacteroides immunogenum TaxID=83262 RepID=UPI000A580580
MSFVHLARFGNKSNAHSVLGHSGLDGDLLTYLTFRSDAPPESSGLGLDAFLSAYRHENWYVVQATRFDPSAPRPGMVVTTAAIIPLEDIASIDIVAIWDTLRKADLSVDRPLETDAFIQLAPPSSQHDHAVGAGATASAILQSGRVIWTGPGLEECIGCLWMHLRAEDRVRLVVGAAAHPGRIAIPTAPDSMTIIATAPNVANRWANWPVSSMTAAPTQDAARDALFGDDAGRSEALTQQLELSSVANWRHLATASALLSRIADLGHEECRALLQLLGYLQPNPARGVAVKTQALECLDSLTTGAEFSEVWGLRGLPWHTVAGARPHQFLRKWADAAVSDSTRSDDILSAVAAVQAASDDDRFAAQLSSCLGAQIDSESLRVLAAVSIRDPRGPRFLGWLTRTDLRIEEIDSAYAEAAQNMQRPPSWLLQSSLALGLAQTHAAAVDIEDPVAAWSRQFEVKPRSHVAEDALEARTGPAGVVAAAFAFADRELLGRAADAVLADSTLLRGGCLADKRFRAVWFEAVSLGADPWASVDPSSAVNPLLDLLIGGASIPPEILNSLSRTTAADISAYPARSSVWAQLPDEAVAGFKSATAEALARSYHRGDPAPEHPLQAAILARSLLASVSRESATQAINLIEGMPTARSLDAVVVATNGRFSPAEEKSLAAVVLARRWRGAAEAIMGLSDKRTDLRWAAQRASSLLGLWDRINFFTRGGGSVPPSVSRSDLHTGIEETAVALYPDGPKTDGIWQRAGGDEADVVAASTGRLAWGHAIQAVIHGRRGAPTAHNLVDQMVNDFPNNPRLKNLKALIDKGITS